MLKCTIPGGGNASLAGWDVRQVSSSLKEATLTLITTGSFGRGGHENDPPGSRGHRHGIAFLVMSRFSSALSVSPRYVSWTSSSTLRRPTSSWMSS